MKDNKDLVIGFLGFGEIGSSLYRIYEKKQFKKLIKRDPFIKLNDTLEECDIINVCIPYFSFKEFIKSLEDLNNNHCIFIIQSTLGIGVCDKLQKIFQNVIVHSPVRGVHPNLTEGIYTFDKYIGFSDSHYNSKKYTNFLSNHLKYLDLKPVVTRTKESELAKIVSTTLYGINIAAINDVFLLCIIMHIIIH